MLAEDKLSKYRAEVIERFINLEWLMNAIISQHYFSHGNAPFIFEVLYNEQFSFGLRRNVLENILGVDESKHLQKLHRLNRIRNLFAHCNQQILRAGSPHWIVPNPRKPEQDLDFKKLYKEFVEQVGVMEQYLAEMYSRKGGQFEEEPKLP